VVEREAGLFSAALDAAPGAYVRHH